MTQTPNTSRANTRHSSSRLVSLLATLADQSAAPTRSHIAQGLGRMIDLSNSIEISDTLDSVSRINAAQPDPANTNPVQRLQLGHAAMVKAVTGSLSRGSSPARITLGMFLEDQESTGVDEQVDYQPYLKLYGALQRDLEFKARNIQADIRKALAASSPEGAQLAAVDAALADPVAKQSRAVFAKIPGLLKTRFQTVANQSDTTVALIHDQLSDLLQTILLAEIEARLLPALGLIEALEDDIETRVYE